MFVCFLFFAFQNLGMNLEMQRTEISMNFELWHATDKFLNPKAEMYLSLLYTDHIRHLWLFNPVPHWDETRPQILLTLAHWDVTHSHNTRHASATATPPPPQTLFHMQHFYVICKLYSYFQLLFKDLVINHLIFLYFQTLQWCFVLIPSWVF